MGADEDAKLVARATGGDRDAFGELVVRHQRALFAVARAYFASEADAEDAVQDAFVKAYENLGQLRRPARFAAWAARIAVNVCRDILRSRSDKLSLEEFSTSVFLVPRLARQQVTPGTLASKAERAEMLRAAVGRLPEHQRVVVMLRYGGELSYEQIAAYLEVPLSTVESRLYKAKRALRKLLSALQAADE